MLDPISVEQRNLGVIKRKHMNFSDNKEVIICEACTAEFSVTQLGLDEDEVVFCPFCGSDLHAEFLDDEDDQESDDDEDEDW